MDIRRIDAIMLVYQHTVSINKKPQYIACDFGSPHVVVQDSKNPNMFIIHICNGKGNGTTSEEYRNDIHFACGPTWMSKHDLMNMQEEELRLVSVFVSDDIHAKLVHDSGELYHRISHRAHLELEYSGNTLSQKQYIQFLRDLILIAKE
jgi:hypothetical protein